MCRTARHPVVDRSRKYWPTWAALVFLEALFVPRTFPEWFPGKVVEPKILVGAAGFEPTTWAGCAMPRLPPSLDTRFGLRQQAAASQPVRRARNGPLGPTACGLRNPTIGIACCAETTARGHAAIEWDDPSGDGWDRVHLPRLYLHLGQVAGRQECGAARYGQEPLRTRTGGGSGDASHPLSECTSCDTAE